MQQKNITTSIQILNELNKSNFLHTKEIKLDLNFYKNIIKNKKITNLNDIFKDFKDSPSDSVEETISDSIPVTNFSIPSSMYNKNRDDGIENFNKNANII